MVQAFTVYYGLVTLGAMREGSTVLIHSAGGGCGLNALAICDALGASAVREQKTNQSLGLRHRRYSALTAWQTDPPYSLQNCCLGRLSGGHGGLAEQEGAHSEPAPADDGRTDLDPTEHC